MWLLIIVALSGPGQMQGHVIGNYDKHSDCTSEKVRILGEMQKAYPGDQDYDLVCLKPQVKA